MLSISKFSVNIQIETDLFPDLPQSLLSEMRERDEEIHSFIY